MERGVGDSEKRGRDSEKRVRAETKERVSERRDSERREKRVR